MRDGERLLTIQPPVGKSCKGDGTGRALTGGEM